MLSLNLALRRGRANLTAWRASAILLACLIMACGVVGVDKTPAYRYRLTVEVETPEGLRSGSSVIEVQTSLASSSSIASPGSVSHRVRGEAVVVDLPDSRTLFALLRSDVDMDWASRVMFMLARQGVPDAEDPFLARFNNLLKLKGTIELPRTWQDVAHRNEESAYPMLVTFDDLDEPTSVDRVDPENLAAKFGAGFSLKRITVELTDSKVSSGLRGRLKWLSDYPEPRLDPEYEGSTDPNLSQRLWHGDFIKEKHQ